MPELPEVEIVRTGLESYLKNQVIEQITSFRLNLRYPLPNFNCLAGQRLLNIRRRSKYLLFEFEKESSESDLLVWHLGMTGQFHVLPHDAQAAAHEHVRFDFYDGLSLRYRDARRFGYAGLMPLSAWLQHPWYLSLGVEPLEPGFSLDTLANHCKSRKAPIKTVIMDAAVVVGVGNIYASESLFLAGIHPKRAAGRIAAERLEMLVVAIKQTLLAAIEAGGSSISDFVKVDGKPGYFAHAFNVYGRDGQLCLRCGGMIKRIVQAGRSSFYCSGCQH